RLFDVLISPAILDYVSLQHLPQEVGAATGGVLLLECDHVAGAHGVLLTFAAPTPTLPHADAAQRSALEASLIVGKMKVRPWIQGFVITAQTQIFINPVGVYDLAGIHLPVGIPNGLEFPKG